MPDATRRRRPSCSTPTSRRAPTSPRPTPSPRRRSPRPTTARPRSCASINLAGARPRARGRRSLHRGRSRRARAGSPARSARPTARCRSRPTSSDPGARAVDFDEVYDAYREQAIALYDGGVDLFLVETIFDTLNAKAALKAILDLADDGRTALPIWISGTIADRSGRTLSGQTVDAFWTSVRHAEPFAVGPQLRARRRAHAAVSWPSSRRPPTRSSRPIRTPGLPNELGEYDEEPGDRRRPAARVGAGAVSSTSSAAAAARRPRTSARSREAVAGLPPREVPRDRAGAAAVGPRAVRRMSDAMSAAGRHLADPHRRAHERQRLGALPAR